MCAIKKFVISQPRNFTFINVIFEKYEFDELENILNLLLSNVYFLVGIIVKKKVLWKISIKQINTSKIIS